MKEKTFISITAPTTDIKHIIPISSIFKIEIIPHNGVYNSYVITLLNEERFVLNEREWSRLKEVIPEIIDLSE